MKEQITFDIFDKIDIRVGTVISVKKNEKARKPSLVIEVDFGKEIGIRKAIGATKKDILTQFLMEAVFLSEFGGIVGIIMGISASTDAHNNSNNPTKLT